jgi:hypothetical protein
MVSGGTDGVKGSSLNTSCAAIAGVLQGCAWVSAGSSAHPAREVFTKIEPAVAAMAAPQPSGVCAKPICADSRCGGALDIRSTRSTEPPY